MVFEVGMRRPLDNSPQPWNPPVHIRGSLFGELELASVKAGHHFRDRRTVPEMRMLRVAHNSNALGMMYQPYHCPFSDA